MFDEERELPFDLHVSWSRTSLISLPAPAVPTHVEFPFSYLSKLVELKAYFTPKKTTINDTFIGTVEELNGDMGSDGQRAGEVLCNLLIDTDVVKAKVNLSSEQYRQAIRAHERGGAYVVMKGILRRQGRVAKLEGVSEFKIAEN